MSADAIQVRFLTELDLDGIVRIGEKTRNRYEPDLWEGRVTYYLRRAPEGSVVAEVDGRRPRPGLPAWRVSLNGARLLAIEAVPC